MATLQQPHPCLFDFDPELQARASAFTLNARGLVLSAFLPEDEFRCGSCRLSDMNQHHERRLAILLILASRLSKQPNVDILGILHTVVDNDTDDPRADAQFVVGYVLSIHVRCVGADEVALIAIMRTVEKQTSERVRHELNEIRPVHIIASGRDFSWERIIRQYMDGVVPQEPRGANERAVVVRVPDAHFLRRGNVRVSPEETLRLCNPFVRGYSPLVLPAVCHRPNALIWPIGITGSDLDPVSFMMCLRPTFQRAIIEYSIVFGEKRRGTVSFDSHRTYTMTDLLPPCGPKIHAGFMFLQMKFNSPKVRLSTALETMRMDTYAMYGRDVGNCLMTSFADWGILLLRTHEIDHRNAPAIPYLRRTLERISACQQRPALTSAIARSFELEHRNVTAVNAMLIFEHEVLHDAFGFTTSDDIAHVYFNRLAALSQFHHKDKKRPLSKGAQFNASQHTEKHGTGKSYGADVVRDTTTNVFHCSNMTAPSIASSTLDAAFLIADETTAPVNDPKLKNALKEAFTRTRYVTQIVQTTKDGVGRCVQRLDQSANFGMLQLGNQADDSIGERRMPRQVQRDTRVRQEEITASALEATGHIDSTRARMCNAAQEYFRDESALVCAIEEALRIWPRDWETTCENTNQFVGDIRARFIDALLHAPCVDDWYKLMNTARLTLIKGVIFKLFVQEEGIFWNKPFDWDHMRTIIHMLHLQRAHIAAAVGILMPFFSNPVFDLVKVALQRLPSRPRAWRLKKPTDPVTDISHLYQRVVVCLRLENLTRDVHNSPDKFRQTIINALAARFVEEVSRQDGRVDVSVDQLHSFSANDVAERIAEIVNQSFTLPIQYPRATGNKHVQRCAVSFCAACQRWYALPLTYVLLRASHVGNHDIVCPSIENDDSGTMFVDTIEQSAPPPSQPPPITPFSIASRTHPREVPAAHGAGDPASDGAAAAAVAAAPGAAAAAAIAESPGPRHDGHVLAGSLPQRIVVRLYLARFNFFVVPDDGIQMKALCTTCNTRQAAANIAAWRDALIDPTGAKPVNIACEHEAVNAEAFQPDYRSAAKTVRFRGVCPNRHRFAMDREMFLATESGSNTFQRDAPKDAPDDDAPCPMTGMYCKCSLCTRFENAPTCAPFNIAFPRNSHPWRAPDGPVTFQNYAEYLAERLLLREIEAQCTVSYGGACVRSLADYRRYIATRAGHVASRIEKRVGNPQRHRIFCPTAILRFNNPFKPGQRNPAFDVTLEVEFGLHRALVGTTPRKLRSMVVAVLGVGASPGLSSEAVFLHREDSPLKAPEPTVIEPKKSTTAIRQVREFNRAFIEQFGKRAPPTPGIDSDVAEALLRRKRMHGSVDGGMNSISAPTLFASAAATLDRFAQIVQENPRAVDILGISACRMMFESTARESSLDEDVTTVRDLLAHFTDIHPCVFAQAFHNATMAGPRRTDCEAIRRVLVAGVDLNRAAETSGVSFFGIRPQVIELLLYSKRAVRTLGADVAFKRNHPNPHVETVLEWASVGRDSFLDDPVNCEYLRSLPFNDRDNPTPGFRWLELTDEQRLVSLIGLDEVYNKVRVWRIETLGRQSR